MIMTHDFIKRLNFLPTVMGKQWIEEKGAKLAVIDVRNIKRNL
jgi:hypothetical protein